MRYDPPMRSLTVSAPNTVLTNEARGARSASRGVGRGPTISGTTTWRVKMVVDVRPVTAIMAVQGRTVPVLAGMSRCPGRGGRGGALRSRRLHIQHRDSQRMPVDAPENSGTRRVLPSRRPPPCVTTLSFPGDHGALPAARHFRTKSSLSANGFRSLWAFTGHRRFRALQLPSAVDRPAGCDVSPIY